MFQFMGEKDIEENGAYRCPWLIVSLTNWKLKLTPTQDKMIAIKVNRERKHY